MKKKDKKIMELQQMNKALIEENRVLLNNVFALSHYCVDTLLTSYEEKEQLLDDCDNALNDMNKHLLPDVENTIFSGNATITFFKDGTKTVARCDENDVFSKVSGFAICVAKRVMGKKKFYAALKSLLDKDVADSTDTDSANN